MSEHSPWFTTYGVVQQGKARLFAFPHSGSGAMAYYPWARNFHDSVIEFIGVQLPGRETRLREKPIAQLPLLLQGLLPEIIPLLDKPFVFFGHSLGALVAFELCRALRKQNLPLPRHLFVSAFRSPELSNPNRELHSLPDAAIIDSLKAYGGTIQEILTFKELMALLLPVLRADFSLHETYRYQEESPLSCAITTLAGIEDDIVKPEHMLNWRQQTHAGFQHIQYSGDHFFLHEHMPSITHRLQHALTGD